jgi:hypothetical protein
VGRTHVSGIASRCSSTSFPAPRLRLVERQFSARTKILLHALVTAFNFELAVPVEEIVKVSGPVIRPALRSVLQDETQLPLMLSLADVDLEE